MIGNSIAVLSILEVIHGLTAGVTEAQDILLRIRLTAELSIQPISKLVQITPDGHRGDRQEVPWDLIESKDMIRSKFRAGPLHVFENPLTLYSVSQEHAVFWKPNIPQEDLIFVNLSLFILRNPRSFFYSSFADVCIGIILKTLCFLFREILGIHDSIEVHPIIVSNVLDLRQISCRHIDNEVVDGYQIHKRLADPVAHQLANIRQSDLRDTERKQCFKHDIFECTLKTNLLWDLVYCDFKIRGSRLKSPLLSGDKNARCPRGKQPKIDCNSKFYEGNDDSSISRVF